jgi:hypothetical protein
VGRESNLERKDADYFDSRRRRGPSCRYPNWNERNDNR